MGRPRLRTPQLRGELSAAAVRLLDAGGVPAVTTRAVASAAGTSLAAVDELFGGKPGLVRAIHAEGFRLLAADLRALPLAADPATAVLDLALAIRAFAARRRSLYEVMFSPPVRRVHAEPRGPAGRRRDLPAHARPGRRPPPGGPPRGTAKDAAISLVALVRGLVAMEHAGILGSGPASIARRWRVCVLALVNGLRA